MYGRYSANSPREVNSLHIDYSQFINPVGQLVEIGQHGEIIHRFCSGFNFSDAGHFLSAGHCLSTNSNQQQTCYVYDTDIIDLNRTKVSFNFQCLPSADSRICNVSFEPTYKITRIDGHGFCLYDINQRQLDYAIFHLEPAASQYGYLPLSKNDPVLNDNVMVIHHPLGLPKKYSTGNIHRVYADGSIDHTAHTYGGSSGGSRCFVKSG